MQIKKIDYFQFYNNFSRYTSVNSELMYGLQLNNCPFITIAIPTYKRPTLLKEAISSVLNQQNFDDFEVIILDNDNTNEFTSEIKYFLEEVNDARIRYYCNQQNIGAEGNWTRCIELAGGKWMTMLGDDDILFSDYLSIMCKNIQKNDQLIECEQINFHGYSLPTSKNAKILKYNKVKLNVKRYALGNRAIIHSQIFKVENAKIIGGFNDDYYPFADYMFQAAYLYHFPNSYKLTTPLVGYRWAVNDSLKHETIYKQIKGLKIYKEYFKTKLHLNIYQKIMLECLLVEFKAFYLTRFNFNRKINFKFKLSSFIASKYNNFFRKIYK